MAGVVSRQFPQQANHPLTAFTQSWRLSGPFGLRLVRLPGGRPVPSIGRCWAALLPSPGSASLAESVPDRVTPALEGL